MLVELDEEELEKRKDMMEFVCDIASDVDEEMSIEDIDEHDSNDENCEFVSDDCEAPQSFYATRAEPDEAVQVYLRARQTVLQLLDSLLLSEESPLGQLADLGIPVDYDFDLNTIVYRSSSRQNRHASDGSITAMSGPYQGRLWVGNFMNEVYPNVRHVVTIVHTALRASCIDGIDESLSREIGETQGCIEDDDKQRIIIDYSVGSMIMIQDKAALTPILTLGVAGTNC